MQGRLLEIRHRDRRLQGECVRFARTHAHTHTLAERDRDRESGGKGGGEHADVRLDPTCTILYAYALRVGYTFFSSLRFIYTSITCQHFLSLTHSLHVGYICRLHMLPTSFARHSHIHYVLYILCMTACWRQAPLCESVSERECVCA